MRPKTEVCHRKRKPAGRQRVTRLPVYVIDGSRTARQGARQPGTFTPVDLAAMRPSAAAAQPFAPDAFDQVILGCVSVIADEMNRRVSLRFVLAWARQ